MSSAAVFKQWLKKVGEKIGAGEVLALIETDKATMEWEVQEGEEGIIAKLLVEEGATDVPVGQPVLVVVQEEVRGGTCMLRLACRSLHDVVHCVVRMPRCACCFVNYVV